MVVQLTDVQSKSERDEKHFPHQQGKNHQEKGGKQAAVISGNQEVPLGCCDIAGALKPWKRREAKVQKGRTNIRSGF